MDVDAIFPISYQLRCVPHESMDNACVAETASSILNTNNYQLCMNPDTAVVCLNRYINLRTRIDLYNSGIIAEKIKP